MKRLAIIPAVLALGFMLGGCRRHYNINYVRVAEDTLHQSVDTPEAVATDDGTFMEVPATPQAKTARDIMDSKNRDAAKEAERLFSGEDGYEELPIEE